MLPQEHFIKHSHLETDHTTVAELVDHKWRRLVVKGVAWNTLYHIFQAIVSFIAMLILVRVVSPAEFGKVTAVVALLAFINGFNCSVFMSAALQLPEGTEPDWSLHWTFGFYIQLALSLICHALAGLCWFVNAYRPIAGPLHLAALGLLIDCPIQLRFMMLRRAMDFRRLRVLLGAGTLASTAVTVALGMCGAGVYAIVLGSNVLIGLPFGIDLLLVRRWRPQRGWFRPNWRAYRPALRFGFQQAGSALLRSGRSAMESAILLPSAGLVAMGLWSRAQALYNTSVGRMTNVLIESSYPLLPRYAADPHRYPRQATFFFQAMVWIAIPGSFYLGVEGRQLSRLVYGAKWIAGDPLILPAAIACVALVIFTISSTVMLATNRLRSCFALELVSGVFTITSLPVIWITGSMVAYAWAFAAAQVLAVFVAIFRVSRLLVPNWPRIIFLPALLGGILASGAVIVIDRLAAYWSLLPHVILGITVYTLIVLLVHRLVFPSLLADFVDRMPGATRLKNWLRLSTGVPRFA